MQVLFLILQNLANNLQKNTLQQCAGYILLIISIIFIRVIFVVSIVLFVLILATFAFTRVTTNL